MLRFLEDKRVISYFGTKASQVSKTCEASDSEGYLAKDMVRSRANASYKSLNDQDIVLVIIHIVACI